MEIIICSVKTKRKSDEMPENVEVFFPLTAPAALKILADPERKII
jgi:hypothetical protein